MRITSEKMCFRSREKDTKERYESDAQLEGEEVLTLPVVDL